MSKVSVLIGNEAFDMQTHGGVSKCFCELIPNLQENVSTHIGILATDNVHLQQLGYLSFEKFVENQPMYKPYYKGIYTKAYRHYLEAKYLHPFANSQRSINSIYNCYLLQKQDFDVYHPTFFDCRFLKYIKNKPFVLTVHDMIVEIYKGRYFPSNEHQVLAKQELIPLADHIIAVSECTKYDLIDIFHIPEDKVTVIHHGYDEQNYSYCKKSSVNSKYILYVGQRHMYKQFNNFVLGCFKFLRQHPDIKVICTSTPFNEEEQTLIKRLCLQDRFIHKFVEKDQELMDLYHHALCFVYPSLYEGFGLPILEAYKAGCPVLLNHTSCFPEIAGDAAIYFNLDEEQSNLSDRLTYLYNMQPKEREALLEKQNERLKLYSWKKAAHKLSQVYLRYAH